MSDVLGAVIERLVSLEAEVSRLRTLEAPAYTVLGPVTKLTIASGAITVTGSLHYVESEDANPDTLTTINGGTSGSLLVLRSFSSDRDITVTDGGSLFLNGNCVLDTYQDTLTLIKIGTAWYELARSGNA